jgi:hypothetical protein
VQTRLNDLFWENQLKVWAEERRHRFLCTRITVPAGLTHDDLEWLERMLRALDVPARPPRNPGLRSRR